MTPPFRLNTARRPNAGVAEELCPLGGRGVFEVIRMNIICTMIKNTFQKINLEKTEG